jgi:hypothetical protein
MPKESKKLDELFHDTLKDIYFAEKKNSRDATEDGKGGAGSRPQKGICYASHRNAKPY